MNKNEKIQILSLDLFRTLRYEIEIVENIQKLLDNQGIGWHYILDLAWIVSKIRRLPKGSLILDAGAGGGLVQFVLLELGYNVISVDFGDRKPTWAQARRYGKVISYLNDPTQKFFHPYITFLNKSHKKYSNHGLMGFAKRILENLITKEEKRGNIISRIEENSYRPKPVSGAVNISEENIMGSSPPTNCGRLFFYKADIRNMHLLPNEYVDAVVSVSALEHNDHEDVGKCIEELLRVTKNNGQLIITVSASQAKDWFHEPSKGWCYSETTLKKLFRLPKSVQSNYSQWDALFTKLKKDNNKLHERLSDLYYQSGNNGMPWGKWNPEYQPVGVVKIKQ